MNFNVNELLRYAFAGGVSLLLLYLNLAGTMVDYICKVIGSDSLATISIFVGLILGFITYSLHRAIFYPLLWDLCMVCYLQKKYIKVDKKTFSSRETTKEGKLNKRKFIGALAAIDKVDDARLNQKNKDSIAYLKPWAAEVHFLYCIFFSMLTCLIFMYIKDDYFIFPNKAIWMLPLVFLSAAIVHHRRYKCKEMKLFFEVKTEATNPCKSENIQLQS